MRIEDRKLNRLAGYDYSRDGVSFVTICVHDRTEWFGFVEDGSVGLMKTNVKYLSVILLTVLWVAHARAMEEDDGLRQLVAKAELVVCGRVACGAGSRGRSRMHNPVNHRQF